MAYHTPFVRLDGKMARYVIFSAFFVSLLRSILFLARRVLHYFWRLLIDAPVSPTDRRPSHSPR